VDHDWGLVLDFREPAVGAASYTMGRDQNKPGLANHPEKQAISQPAVLEPGASSRGIVTAQAAEPTEMLTLACRGERIWWGAPNTDPVKEQVTMGIIVNFTARTVNGLGTDWRDAIPIHTISETAITFFAERQNDPVEASIIGTIDRISGDVDAGIKVSGSSGKVSILYSLKCKPGAWG
jgi:hypothetical protein